MKTGDLVKNLTEPETGLGLVIEVGISMLVDEDHEPPGVKVLWHTPSWHDPSDGASVMYADELEIVSESRRSDLI